MAKLFIFLVCLVGFQSFAQSQREILPFEHYKDWKKSSSPQSIKPGIIYYLIEMAPYKTWTQKRPIEFKYLNLFPEYKEPSFKIVTKEGKSEDHLETLRVFNNKARLIIKKPADQIDLSVLKDENTYNNLMTFMKHKFVDNSQIMPVVQDKTSLHTFDFCGPKTATAADTNTVYIKRPLIEGNLNYQMSESRTWCGQPGTQCVRSCVVFEAFSADWFAVKGMNVAKEAMGRRVLDYGMAFESEMRIYKSGSEYGQDLTELTGIPTPVAGVYEQSIFYANQMFQFGKILTVIQADPQDPSRSIASTYFVAGVKETSFNLPLQSVAIASIEDYFKQQLSKMTQEIASRVADYFEK